MSFSITITGQSATELFANLQAAAGATGAVKVTKTTQKAAPAAAETPLPVVNTLPVITAAVPAPVAPVVVETPAAAPAVAAPAAAPAADATGATEEKLRAFLTPFLRDADKAPQVAALIAKYGATKLSKIPADKLDEVMAEAVALFPVSI